MKLNESAISVFVNERLPVPFTVSVFEESLPDKVKLFVMMV